MQDVDEARKAVVEELAEEYLSVELDEGGVNLGSLEDHPMLDDEYMLDEVNAIMDDRQLVIDHGQVFLNAI